MEPRVAVAVDRADQVLLGEELERLVPFGKGLLEDAACGVGREAVDRLLAHAGQSAELGEAPVVQAERLVVVAQVEHEPPLLGPGPERLRRAPAVGRSLLLSIRVLPECLERREGLVGRAAEQLLVGAGQILLLHWTCSSCW